MHRVNTTAFTTPCWTSWTPAEPGQRPPVGWRRWAIGALLALLSWCAPAHADGSDIDVVDLRVEQGDDGLYLSAGVPFELPAIMEDALAKGIALHFTAQAVILRERWYWYDKPVATATRQFRLSFQPLIRRWRLQVVTDGPALALSQNFDTLPEALSALQRIARWRVADSQAHKPGAKQNLAFVFQLDSGKLPRPFQIGNLGQKDWNLVVRRNQRLVVEPAQ